ncbi:MAG: NADAR family protein [Chitinophagales bacterium]
MKYKKLESGYRIYSIKYSCIFKKNKEKFGGLSNMSVFYPLEVNNLKVKSSEALYQACKFPFDKDLQSRIISEKSPFIAKMISKGNSSRIDWMQIRVNVMRWVIQLKLAQNYYSFGKLLEQTKGKNIVENSDRDLFWGAKRINDLEFQGMNVLGRLLMELRHNYFEKSRDEIVLVEPPKIDDFLFLGEKIKTIDMRGKYNKPL